MAIVPLEQTTCYKCPTEIMAGVGEVHPLCADCQNEFDDWLQYEMGMLNS